MTDQMVVQIAREAFFYILIIAGPILLVSLIIGLTIAIFQAATSISEQTLTFVPKIVGVFLITIIIFPYIIAQLKTFTTRMFELIATIGP